MNVTEDSGKGGCVFPISCYLLVSGTIMELPSQKLSPETEPSGSSSLGHEHPKLCTNYSLSIGSQLSHVFCCSSRRLTNIPFTNAQTTFIWFLPFSLRLLTIILMSPNPMDIFQLQLELDMNHPFLEFFCWPLSTVFLPNTLATLLYVISLTCSIHCVCVCVFLLFHYILSMD